MPQSKTIYIKVGEDRGHQMVPLSQFSHVSRKRVEILIDKLEQAKRETPMADIMRTPYMRSTGIFPGMLEFKIPDDD